MWCRDTKWVIAIRILVPIDLPGGFPNGSAGKEYTCSAGDMGLIPGWRRSPGEGSGNPLQYSCLEIPRDRRNLAGYSPWGCKELDTTENNNNKTCLNLSYHKLSICIKYNTCFFLKSTIKWDMPVQKTVNHAHTLMMILFSFFTYLCFQNDLWCMMYDHSYQNNFWNEGNKIFTIFIRVLCLLFGNSISMLGWAKTAPTLVPRLFFESPPEFNRVYKQNDFRLDTQRHSLERGEQSEGS